MNSTPEYWGVAATLIWIATRDIERCSIAFGEDSLFAVAYVLASVEIETQNSTSSIDDLKATLSAMLEKGEIIALDERGEGISETAWFSRRFACEGAQVDGLIVATNKDKFNVGTISNIRFKAVDVQRVWPIPGGKKRGPKLGGSADKKQWRNYAEELIRDGKVNLKPNGKYNRDAIARLIHKDLKTAEQPDTIAKEIRTTIEEMEAELALRMT